MFRFIKDKQRPAVWPFDDARVVQLKRYGNALNGASWPEPRSCTHTDKQSAAAVKVSRTEEGFNNFLLLVCHEVCIVANWTNSKHIDSSTLLIRAMFPTNRWYLGRKLLVTFSPFSGFPPPVFWPSPPSPSRHRHRIFVSGEVITIFLKRFHLEGLPRKLLYCNQCFWCLGFLDFSYTSTPIPPTPSIGGWRICSIFTCFCLISKLKCTTKTGYLQSSKYFL